MHYYSFIANFSHTKFNGLHLIFLLKTILDLKNKKKMEKLKINERLNNENGSESEKNNGNCLRNLSLSSASSSSSSSSLSSCSVTPTTTQSILNHINNSNSNHYQNSTINHNNTNSNSNNNSNINNNLDPQLRTHNQFYAHHSSSAMSNSNSNSNNNNNNNIGISSNINNINWRDEADGSEEEQQLRFNFFPVPNNSTNINSSTGSSSLLFLPPDNDVIDLGNTNVPISTFIFDNEQSFPNQYSSTRNNAQSNRNNNANQNNNNNNNSNNSGGNNNNNKSQTQPTEFRFERMVDLVGSFKKFLKSNDQSEQQTDQNINDTNQSRIKVISDDNAKLNKTSNFNYFMPASMDIQYQNRANHPPTALRNPFRLNSNLPYNSNNKNRKQTNNNNICNQTSQNTHPIYPNHRNYSNYRKYRNEDHTSIRLENQNNQLNALLQQLAPPEDPLHNDNNHLNDESVQMINPNDVIDYGSSNQLDVNYFKLINQQVYQLLLFQNFQINQQHQLIMSWIQCQQEWLRKTPVQSERMRESYLNNNFNNNEEMTSNNNQTIDRMDFTMNHQPVLDNTFNSNNNHSQALNNQTVPSIRSNNFWDNLKNQSLQNIIQSRACNGSDSDISASGNKIMK